MPPSHDRYHRHPAHALGRPGSRPTGAPAGLTLLPRTAAPHLPPCPRLAQQQAPGPRLPDRGRDEQRGAPRRPSRAVAGLLRGRSRRSHGRHGRLMGDRRELQPQPSFPRRRRGRGRRPRAQRRHLGTTRRHAKQPALAGSLRPRHLLARKLPLVPRWPHLGTGSGPAHHRAPTAPRGSRKPKGPTALVFRGAC